jgi:hypothetical protein
MATAAVPEAAIDKDGDPRSPENDIGFASQTAERAAVKPVAQSPRVQSAPQE